jgi:NAD+ synthase (glutamine-hydrolysing)
MGDMQILAAQINPTIGDFPGNCQKILDALSRARLKKVDIVLFPELALSGYFPDDLLLDHTFIDAISPFLEEIEKATKGLFVVVGLPRWNPSRKEKPLYNSAAVFIDGKLVGYKNKSLLPTYDVFDERRFFEPDETAQIWEYKSKRIGITICEDAWQHSGLTGNTCYDYDPIIDYAHQSLDLMLNLSASPYYFNRLDVRLGAFKKVVQTLRCPLVYCNQVGANDQLIFDGHSFYLDKEANLCQMAKGFEADDLYVDLGKKTSSVVFVPPLQNLHSALCLGVRDYLGKQGFKKVLVGLSGGVDSALVLRIAKDAVGAKNVLALTMPSRFSSKGSVDDSIAFAKELDIEIKTVPIESVFQSYLDLLEPFFKGREKDETEENFQSRIRGNILMAFSNKFGAIVLNTGNKSEMAMGYCTLYGDMAGGLGVLQDVTKLQVYKLAEHLHLPRAIIEKPPSAELKFNQKDTDTLPPFEILDPILEDYIEEGLSGQEIAKKRGHPLAFVADIIHKVHAAEYKRRQAPIGIRVTRKAFSKGRLVPIVQRWL